MAEIRWQFTIAKVQTMADGSPRIVMDLPQSEDAIKAAAEFMVCQSAGAYLDGVATARFGNDDANGSGPRKIHI